MFYNVLFVLFCVLVPLLLDVTVAHHSRGCYSNVTILVKPAKLESPEEEVTLFDTNQLVSKPMLENILCETKIKDQHIPVLYQNSFNGLMSEELNIRCNVSEIKPYTFNNTVLDVLSLWSNQLQEVRADFFFNISVNSLQMGNNKIKYIEKGAFKEIGRSDQPDMFKVNSCKDKLKYPLSDLKINKKNLRGLKDEGSISLENNKLETVPSGVFNNLNVRFLFLSQNQIKVLEPNSFTECSALTHIDLSDNNLTSIEKDVFRCGTLEKLNLRFNSIESIEAGSFQELSNIREIDLHFNKLKVLKRGAFKLSLKELRLSKNEMTSIEAGAFEGLTVEELHLSYNSLHHISKGVFSNFNVTELFLRRNMMTTIEPQAFSDLPELSFLFLNDNNLTYFDKSMFHNVPKLKLIELSRNQILETGLVPHDRFPELVNISVFL